MASAHWASSCYCFRPCGHGISIRRRCRDQADKSGKSSCCQPSSSATTRPKCVSLQTTQSDFRGFSNQGSAQPRRTQLLTVLLVNLWPASSNMGNFPPGCVRPRFSQRSCTEVGLCRGTRTGPPCDCAFNGIVSPRRLEASSPEDPSVYMLLT